MPDLLKSHLISEMIASEKKSFTIKRKEAEFIISSYIKFMTDAIANGNHVSTMGGPSFRLGYALYEDMPGKYRDKFRFTNKIFGRIFLPVVDNRWLEHFHYNFLPADSFMEKIYSVMETDAAYEINK